MKIAIVGSRDYPNLNKVVEFVNSLPLSAVIVSGGAKGVDKTAEVAAKARNLPCEIFLPEWKRFGKKAGIMRNGDIVANSDLVVAFWDGQSIGTKDSIDRAKYLSKLFAVILPNDPLPEFVSQSGLF